MVHCNQRMAALRAGTLLKRSPAPTFCGVGGSHPEPMEVSKKMTTADHLPQSASLGDRLLRLLVRIGEASGPGQRARYADRLFAMSDAELADRGLARDGIIRHAFRGYF